MNKRLKEILERKQEIRSQVEAGGDIDFEKLNTEIDELDKEERGLEARAAVASKLNDGKDIEARILGGSGDLENRQTKENNVLELRWSEAVDTTEYRDAWAKEMMGQNLSQEERSLMDKVNTEYRDFTHTTQNSEILIPKTISDGIWTQAEEVSALWSAVNKLRVRGDLTIITGSAGEKARFYDEATVVETDELKFASLDLKGHELAKAIQVSWKLKKMSVQDFIAYIMREIGTKMGEALSYAVYQGLGSNNLTDGQKPEPLGIKTALMAEADTPRVIAAASPGELSYTDLTKLRAAVKSVYASGSTIYANNLTIWNVLANLVDGVGRPLFMADAINGGVGRILGVSVVADVAIPEGEILVGNLQQGYTANINEDITMYTEDHVRERLTDYMGYAIVDGAPKDTEAFAILDVGSLPEA